VFALTAAGAVLRFSWLGRESLWLDEAASVAQAQRAIRSIICSVTRGEASPPLYYTALHFWMALGRSEAAVRGLSALLGTASIPLLCRLGRRLLGPRAALLAGLLFTIAPLHLYYSQEARTYALLVFLAVASTDAMLSLLRQKSRRAWLLYVASAGAMLYAHYHGFYVLLAQAAFAASGAGGSQARIRLLGAQAVAALLFAFWVPSLVAQVLSGGGAWIAATQGRPGLPVLGAAYVSFAVGPHVRRWEAGLAPLLAILALMGIPGPGGCRERPVRRWAPDMAGSLLACWLVLPVLLPFVLSQARPHFLPRYVIGSFPGAVLLAARGLERLHGRRPHAAWLLLALTLGIWMKIDADFYRFRTKENWRGVVHHLATQGQSGDVVVFYPPWNKIPYDYYARGQVALPTYSPQAPRQDSAPSEVCARLVARYSRVWVVERVARRWFDPGGKLLRCLDLRAARSGRWDYNRVTVRLYLVKSTSGQETSSRPTRKSQAPIGE
jgi:4-amino-4-deoxy-L-arabinose transferase-like glycosyltransferase